MIVVNCVGVGHWGPNLVRVFATHPQARVNKVCDLSEERLALVRRNIPNIGANAAYSGSITSNISLVINSTPGTTQTFNAANTYVGTTTINSGNLYCNADNVIPTGTPVTIGSTANLNLGGYGQTISALSGTRSPFWSR